MLKYAKPDTVANSMAAVKGIGFGYERNAELLQALGLFVCPAWVRT